MIGATCSMRVAPSGTWWSWPATRVKTVAPAACAEARSTKGVHADLLSPGPTGCSVRLRQLQGDSGEFAITAFGSRGLLWADEAWWEIDPIGVGNIDEAVAASVFCMAWVVARRFRRAAASEALAYAHAAAGRAMIPVANDSDSKIAH